MSIYTVFSNDLGSSNPCCSGVLIVVLSFLNLSHKFLLPAIWEWNDLTGKIAAFIYEHLVEHLEDQRRH